MNVLGKEGRSHREAVQPCRRSPFHPRDLKTREHHFWRSFPPGGAGTGCDRLLENLEGGKVHSPALEPLNVVHICLQTIKLQPCSKKQKLLILPFNASDGQPLTHQYSQSSVGLKIPLESGKSFSVDIQKPVLDFMSLH